MELTNEQKNAVTTTSKRVLVVAGAGSGKTRVLTERVGHLFDNCGVSPVEILAITFTRLAGQEMAKRIEARLGVHGRRVEVGTMHGVALGFLKRFGELVGFRPRTLSVYSEWQSNFLLEDCAVEMGIKKGKTWKISKKEVLSAFMAYEANGVMPQPETSLYGLLLNFNHRCKENNACTYGQLLTYFEQLIDKGVIDRYTSWLHVLVDEVQDLDARQWRIVEKLTKDRSLFAVGDLRQSIYSFRGACPQYLFDRASSFDLYNLTANFRSSSVIVEAANRLISHNGMVLGEPMVSAVEIEGADASISVSGGLKSEDLASFLATTYTGNVVILSRVHGLLGKLARELEQRGVKPLYLGQTAATTRTEVFARIHAMVHLMANPFDNFSFLLAREYLGVLSRDEFREIRQEALESGVSHFQAWQNRGGVTGYPGPGDSISQATDFIFSSIVFSEEMSNDLVKTFNFMQVVRERFPTMTVETYLEYLATMDVQDDVPSVEDFPRVTLMTIHASKGLEFDNVIVWGANEGILPDNRAMNNPEEMEGERRLAYVGMTRAIKRLGFAVRPEDEKTGPPSRFIAESI